MAALLAGIADFFTTALSVARSLISGISVFDLLDIAVIALLIYKLIDMCRETRSKQLVKGILLVLAVWALAHWLGMNTVDWLIRKIAESALLALAIIFQPELRRALEHMGRSNFGSLGFAVTVEEERESILSGIDAVCRACANMQEEKVGALIVFERKTGLGEIINTGTVLSAEASQSLLCNIFFPKSPLHDGAVIIRAGKVHAAGCILPLTSRNDTDRSLGTRHRAAIGMSENSDAVVAVVSEETGTISLAIDGELTRNYTPITLREALGKELLPVQEENKKGILSFFKRSKGGSENNEQ